ncbi:MAG: hypothetical protein GDA56_31095 [Hormoscilla sp. GM7CHS1pb]|nr:hypothetical protein [Hormoscilla sp. GM7CHS1pb]
MNVWLAIANPYAYDEAMWRAISEAQQRQTQLVVVYFIGTQAMGNMMHDLAEVGFIGHSSLRNLQSSMLAGYRGLADDVLQRVQRKAKGIELQIEGVVEEPSLFDYILQIAKQDPAKIVIAGSNLNSLTSALDKLPEIVEYIEEE